MAIIETKADELMALVHRKKSITSKDAASMLQVDEEYVRRLAIVLQKHKLINLNASAFKLTLLATQD